MKLIAVAWLSSKITYQTHDIRMLEQVEQECPSLREDEEWKGILKDVRRHTI